MAAAAAAATTMAKRLVSSLRSPAYHSVQGKAKSELEDVIMEVRLLGKTLKPKEPPVNVEQERRIANLEALNKYGMLVLGGLLFLYVGQAPIVYQLQKDNAAMAMRLDRLERAEKVAQTSPPPSVKPTAKSATG